MPNVEGKKTEDVLSQFIENETKGMSSSTINREEVNMDTQIENMVYGREFFAVDPNSLPAGIFYKPGTKISIKGATVADVQEYSVVDNANIVDVTEKMNMILSRCVRFTHPNGMQGTYKDVKDNDRLSLIFMIRELTFQKGNNLAKKMSCEHCGHEFKIEFRATNSQYSKRTFKHIEMEEELKEFFNPQTKTVDLDVNNKSWKLTPPTIGLQEIFFNDLKTKVQISNINPNVSFLKVIPFTLWDRNKISEDGIKSKEKEYKEMDMDTFQTLNYAVDKMKFGVNGLEDKCPICGGEVHTDMSFPGGASNIFVISSPLGGLKKK